MQLSQADLRKEAKNFHLKKRLGQHFLVDPETLQQIASALSATADDTIIEVGPGIGFLTRLLCDTGAKVIAVDLDRESIAALQELALPNVELIHGDFLRFDLGSLSFFNKESPAVAHSAKGSQLKVVGNVPYQITGLILGHILGEIDQPAPWLGQIDTIVVTVQREVARRMVAQPGTHDYSRVSLLINYFCQASIEAELSADVFYPPPKVASAIVKLVPRRQPIVTPKDTRLMKKVIEAGFRQRRKMLRNGLSFLKLEQEKIDAIFQELSLDPQVRAERLSLEQFAILSDCIGRYLNNNAHDKNAGPSEG